MDSVRKSQQSFSLSMSISQLSHLKRPQGTPVRRCEGQGSILHETRFDSVRVQVLRKSGSGMLWGGFYESYARGSPDATLSPIAAEMPQILAQVFNWVEQLCRKHFLQIAEGRGSGASSSFATMLARQDNSPHDSVLHVNSTHAQ